jgi:oligoendopeptidase F
VAQGNFNALLGDSDRRVRRTAWESFGDAHLSMKNTMANCLSAGVQQHVFAARVRKYGSSLEAAVQPNFIPVEVFHNLIDTYRRNLPTWHRYWAIRRRALGYDKLHVYDVKAPLTQNPPEVPYAKAVEWISDGMQPLGDEYVSVMRRGATEEHWVDIYPNQRKASGAYSDGFVGTHPFILMSYTDDIYSMSTLAHELGHSMHSYLTWKNQPMAYAFYGMFAAEVASNFNQAMVRAHLMKTNPDRDFQISVIEEAMSNFHRYFFIMPALARLELEIHQRVERGLGLSADYVSGLMADLFREGYGTEVEIDADRIGITWAEFSGHMYMNFYVYQYATGISAANALARKVLEDGDEAAARYISFLSSGDSLYPMDALKLAGVDMASPEPVEKTFGVLAEMVDRLADLVGERVGVEA